MPDPTTQVRAILGRTLRELEQVIDNASVTSLLRGLGSVLGLDDDAATATSEPASRRAAAAKPTRGTAPRASRARAARLPGAKSAKANPRSRTAVTPKTAATARVTSGAPRARKGGRRDQLLALVVDQPGITLARAAKRFGLKDATGLYAVARRLQDDGLVRKSGVELHPTAKAHQK